MYSDGRSQTSVWLGDALVAALRDGALGIALTGAGSWLGQALLGMLAAEGALPSRLRLFGSSSRTLCIGERAYAVEALADAPPLTPGPWLLLHCAFLGKERTADITIEAFLAANDAILAHVLRIAAPVRDLRVVFTSSGAVYGPGRTLVATPDESAYGWCKIAQERRLTAWCADRDTPLVVPRIFNIGGPFANKVESYALSSFILAAHHDGKIRIRARKPTFRSYVHVNEVLTLTCTSALTQPVGAPLIFDTAGDEIIEMAGLAARVAAAMPKPCRISRESVEGLPDRYVGDGAAYRALLRAQGRSITPLDCIIADTAAFLAPQPKTPLAD